MKPANRKRVEELEKTRNSVQKRPSYALVIYSPEISDFVSSFGQPFQNKPWGFDSPSEHL